MMTKWAMTKTILIPKGYHRIAENSNINGSLKVTSYFNQVEGKLYVTVEQTDGEMESFGPFNPAFLELLVLNLSDVLQMKGAYHAV